jgi:anti-sigma regulatory factor (Ser/Thr protein kinase)
VLNQQITLRAAHVRKARLTVREQLAASGYGPDDISTIETVVAELLGAAVESGVRGQVQLTVQTFPLLTNVRVRCSRDVSLDTEPLGLRERILERLTVGVGYRRNGDDTYDLWAEVPRRTNGRAMFGDVGG